MSAARPRFGPVDRRTLAEAIRAQIHQQILDGTLPPGSRLPSERELCEEFDMDHTSVREALQGLMSIGVVTRRGNRAYVSEELPAFGTDVLQAARVHELFEVRRLMELPMTELAACRADDTERVEILALAEDFTEVMLLVEFRQLDRKFHSAIARASHNTLLAEVYGKVLDALFGSEQWSTILHEAPTTVIGAIIDSSGHQHRPARARMISRTRGGERCQRGWGRCSAGVG